MRGLHEGRKAWLLVLPPAFAAGAAYLAWAVAGALQKGTLVQVTLSLGVAFALVVIWVAESGLLSRLLKLSFVEAAVKIALSWTPLVIFPFSAPYFNHWVFSSFLKNDPSSTRILLVVLWLVGLAVVGSVVIKVILFNGGGGVLAALERQSVKILWTGVALYFLVFVSLAFLAYSQYRFHSDLGEYNQTLWATLRGHIFYTSLEETADSYLGTHISPFLLMILPVYAIYQSPLTYLLLRSLALSLAAVPLFYLVRRMTNSGTTSLLLAGAFLFHPEIVSQHLTPGYEVVFVASLFFAAFYFFRERRFWWFIFFLAMVLAVREDFIPTAFMFAVYALLKRRSLAWYIVPLAMFVVWEGAVQLIFNAVIEHNVFRLYYGHFGNSPAEMVKTIVMHPLYALEEIRKYQATFIYNLLMPEGLIVPWLSPASIFAIPNLLISIARGQDFSVAAGGISHYGVMIISGLWLGLAEFVTRMRKWAHQASWTTRETEKAMLIVAVVIVVLVASTAHLWAYYLPTGRPAEAAALDQAISMIPPDASVSSNDGRAIMHMSNRMYIYEPLVWDVIEEPDRLPQGVEQLKADYVILKPFGNSFFNDAGAFQFLTEAGSPYKLIFDQDGIRLFKRENGN